MLLISYKSVLNVYALYGFLQLLLLNKASADGLCGYVRVLSFSNKPSFWNTQSSFGATVWIDCARASALWQSKSDLESRVASSSKALSPSEWTSCLCLGRTAAFVVCIFVVFLLSCHVMKTNAKDENRRDGVTWLWYTTNTHKARDTTLTAPVLIKAEHSLSLLLFFPLWSLVIWVYDLLFSATLTYFFSIRPSEPVNCI